MRVQLLITCTLAALASACSSTWGCDPPSEAFSFDAALTEADVGELLTRYSLSDRGEITCEAACSYTYERDRGWSSAQIDSCTLSVAPTEGATPETEVGSVQCEGTGYEYFCEGRRPLGHADPEDPASRGPALPAYLARCAHLEAASVVAFEELAQALVAAGAPAPLVDRCRRAAADERRHAAQVGAQARRRGAIPPAVARRRQPPALAALAVDNAREGCVLETWSALRAAWLAEHAADPELRAMYAALAADEAAHAQLSWDLHAWLIDQVDPATREAATQALRRALAELPRLAALQAQASPPDLAMAPTLAFALAERFAAGLAAAA
ncbi:MAG: ferritin-like domain-containing protein [Nannocystaceae bacterium]